MPEVSEQELKDMKIHESKDLDNFVTVQRVIGGWVYWKYSRQSSSNAIALAGVFVPESKD